MTVMKPITNVFFRHGDLLFKRAENVKKSELKAKSGVVVAEGETTGHKHQFSSGQVQLYGTQDITHVEILSKESQLSHEEHKTIVIPKGMYEIVYEREFNPFQENEWRRVLD